jgi:hypothetical protein
MFSRTRRQRCLDCAGGWIVGDGKCAQCNGTGVNTQLDSAQPKCPYCKGTGLCGTCGGSGTIGDDMTGGDQILSLFK